MHPEQSERSVGPLWFSYCDFSIPTPHVGSLLSKLRAAQWLDCQFCWFHTIYALNTAIDVCSMLFHHTICYFTDEKPIIWGFPCFLDIVTSCHDCGVCRCGLWRGLNHMMWPCKGLHVCTFLLLHLVQGRKSLCICRNCHTLWCHLIFNSIVRVIDLHLSRYEF